MKHVDAFHSRWPLLLVAENEVDPFVKVGAHVVALKGLFKDCAEKYMLSRGSTSVFFLRDLGNRIVFGAL